MNDPIRIKPVEKAHPNLRRLARALIRLAEEQAYEAIKAPEERKAS